jgi:hypothetical protein
MSGKGVQLVALEVLAREIARADCEAWKLRAVQAGYAPKIDVVARGNQLRRWVEERGSAKETADAG